MGILSGLEGFGLGGLTSAKIYNAKEEAEAAAEVSQKPVAVSKGNSEADMIFAKGFRCPCCDKEFKSKTVKIGKAKLVDTDLDLRPKYEGIDTLKYDVIMCPHCGYSALSRFFQYLTGPQAKLININISQAFTNTEKEGDILTYDQSIERYKLALANAVVKKSRASEKAYICLKLGWVIRGKLESMSPEEEGYAQQQAELKKEEDEILKSALDGFVAAMQAENFPMCGMDESTVNYLIAALAYRFGQLDVSAKMVSAILTSNVANKRMKDRARVLKDMIVTQIKNQKK